MIESFRESLPPTCDVVVVGAGPAGLAAAIQAVRTGAKTVVLLDGRDPWREPVSCAEAVRQASFLKWSPLDASPWKRRQILGCILGTQGASFEWRSPDDSGWILDRAGYHRGLADHCVELGVVCHFRTRVVGVSGPDSTGFRLVELHPSEDRSCTQIKARRVIDASGPGSSIGRDEGFAQGKDDLETGAFALVEGLTYPGDAIQLWLHPSYAPGGYAWLFPRDDRVANVGVVVGRGSSISSRKGLEIFLEGLLPGASKGIQVRGGAIPNGYGGGRIAHNGLFKAGDAAGMINAISRGGIVESLCAGTLAGRHAARSLVVDGLDIEERAYQKSWMTEFGNRQKWLSRLKPLIHKIPVSVLRLTFQRLAKAPDGYILWHTALIAMFLALVRSPFQSRRTSGRSTP